MRASSPLRVEEIDPPRRPGWVRRHPVLAVLIVLVLVLAVPLGFGLHWWYWPNRPSGDAAEVESVSVRLDQYRARPEIGPGFEQEAVQVTTADPVLIQQLLDVFRTAERAEEHKCGSSGTITVLRKDGAVEELFILPGHEEPYYEYRMGSRINRVDRERFLAALRALGIRQIKTAAP